MLEIFLAGGPVMFPLLLCSVLVLTVVIERIFFWLFTDRNRDRILVADVLELARDGNWEAIRSRATGSRDFVIRILISGILHRDFSMAKAMEAAAAVEVQRMRRYMGVLDTIITVAPLLGIFGTVNGNIHTFEKLGSAGINDPQAVTVGVAQALITTAAGLGIAIFSVFPFNYFNAKVDRAVMEIESTATSLEIGFDKQAHAIERRPGAAP